MMNTSITDLTLTRRYVFVLSDPFDENERVGRYEKSVATDFSFSFRCDTSIKFTGYTQSFYFQDNMQRRPKHLK